MILSRVEITNYKQYGGHHVIEIPQTGAIGVIGANGVGKTTLFEAIEWALYSPSTIKSADVKPRVWRGKTEVTVTLEDPATQARFVVERELGKGSAKARVYRVDEYGFEEKIVDGAAQVTSYVTQNLIGLDHGAFVATFFTRQKELGFFNGSPTTRRRDVGKLLGLETIRDAQQIIADDRKRALADARSYLSQSEAQSKDRDFAAEIATAEAGIADAKQTVAGFTDSLTAAKSKTAAADKDLAAIEQLREQDSALNQRMQNDQRKHDIAKEQAANATRELDRLARLAAEREQKQPIADAGPKLQETEASHAANRQSAMRQRELQQTLTSLDQRDTDAANTIREAISGAPAPDNQHAWHPETPDAAVEWASSIDIRSLEQRATNISAAVDLNEQLTSESARLQTFNQRVEQLHQIQESFLEAGDPAEQAKAIQARLQELNGSITAANTSATRIKGDLQKTDRILAGLRQQHEGEICPTCQRPFTSDDTAHAIKVFKREVENYRQQISQIDKLIAKNRAEIDAVKADEKLVAERAGKLTETRASIESGKRYVQEQQTKVDEISVRLQRVISELGIENAPTAQQRDEEQRALVAWRRVIDAAAAVRKAVGFRQQIVAERQPLEQELVPLKDVAYDEAAHREITEQLQAARDAYVTIRHINEQLARRDEIVTNKDVAEQTISEALQALESLQKERSSLGFDASAHQQAQAAMRSAQESERAITEQKHRAEVALRDSEHTLNTIVNEKDRIGRLALEAEAKQREADDLDLMYKEFTEFERFAAAWYAPRLSEIASDLVSQVTDGKYDRVEFDNNFSIEVYDGDDEKFPYETFSGGERDAIALCARIALSRVIGGASSSPPGFLVLDEVFGSLDLERRQRLLEMLATITTGDEHFKQVFIISHVDDVRTSPILDDIWRVTETEDGTSELQTLGVGEDIGEL